MVPKVFFGSITLGTLLVFNLQKGVSYLSSLGMNINLSFFVLSLKVPETIMLARSDAIFKFFLYVSSFDKLDIACMP